jgi:phospholipid/cholesterol/gamma-HCH transport system substrate-binding protein
MEIRARYVQMGAFTLAVLAAGFAFVYWLNNAGALRTRAIYQVRFDGPVSGLLAGSAVLFNGVRVGEVAALELSAVDARQVLATIAIERTTPVRAGTTVGIDFQGLTGSPVIALTGGSSSEALAPVKGALPLLIAEPGAGQSMSQAAREALKRFDGLLADNAQPIKSVLANLDTFAQALARNSDRVDGIVAGLERMTGGAKARVLTYELGTPRLLTPLEKPLNLQVAIADPTALAALDSDKIQRALPDGPTTALTDAQWSDTLPKLLQTKIIRGLEDANAFAGISRPLEALHVDFQLLIDVRTFRLVASPSGTAEVELAGKILDAKGHIVATQVFAASTRVEGETATAAVAALDQAFSKAGSELMTWAVRTTGNQSDRIDTPKGVVPKKAADR